MLPEGGWEGKRRKEGREEEGREPHTQALSGSFLPTESLGMRLSGILHLTC